VNGRISPCHSPALRTSHEQRRSQTRALGVIDVVSSTCNDVSFFSRTVVISYHGLDRLHANPLLLSKHRYMPGTKLSKPYPAKPAPFSSTLFDYDSRETGSGGNCLLIARIGTLRLGLTSFARPAMQERLVQPCDGIGSFHLVEMPLFTPLSWLGSLFALV
jgi:hypothetical protein